MAIDQSSSMREMKLGSSGGELWNSSQSRSSFCEFMSIIQGKLLDFFSNGFCGFQVVHL